MHEIFSRSHRGPPQTIANAYSLVAAAMYSPPILMLKLRSDERQHHQPSNCALNSLSLHAREASFPIFFPSTEQFITENNREQQIPTCTSLTFSTLFRCLPCSPPSPSPPLAPRSPSPQLSSFLRKTGRIKNVLSLHRSPVRHELEQRLSRSAHGHLSSPHQQPSAPVTVHSSHFLRSHSLRFLRSLDSSRSVQPSLSSGYYNLFLLRSSVIQSLLLLHLPTQLRHPSVLLLHPPISI